MRRRLLVCCPPSALMAMASPARMYYDKVREQREGSDDGPAEMFHEFPTNPAASRVPEELHTPTAEAVTAAEGLQRWFLGATVTMVLGFCLSGFIDPFAEGYRRPQGYGEHAGGVKDRE